MWKKFLKSLKISESYISMALGLLVVVVIGILLFNFFSNRGKLKPLTPQETEKTEEQSTSQALPTNYTVVEGENLWAIAEKHLGSGYNWVDIAKENNLSDPDHLEAGQVLVIPKVSPILPATGVSDEATPTITATSYTVVSGDSLWDIAVKAYGDGFKWQEIATANNLQNPGLIHVGNTLVLPR